MTRRALAALTALLTLLVVAVGLPSPASATTPGDTEAPTAVMHGPSLVSLTATSFTLDGSLSFDLGGTVASYTWRLVEAPPGAPADALDLTSTPATTTTPTRTVALNHASIRPGRWTFGLTVTDDSGNTSLEDRITVIIADTDAPTAVIKAPALVPTTATSFVLDGGLSFDTGGGTIASYTWQLIDAPADAFDLRLGVPATTSTATRTVVLDSAAIRPGRYTFGLSVTDDSGNTSALDQVVVLVVDQSPPVISPRPPLVVETTVLPVFAPYATPTAKDAVDGAVPVTCDLAPGTLVWGTRTVRCTATDSSGNSASTSFVLTVRRPATSGSLTSPRDNDPVVKVRPGAALRVRAGGYAPGSTVDVVAVRDGAVVALGRAVADRGGRIDAVVTPPKSLLGVVQITTMGATSSGTVLERAWWLLIRS